MTRYAVKVPNKHSFMTEIALTLHNDTIVIIQDTKLFDALPDDSKLYILTDEEDDENWTTKEVLTDCSLVMKDLRDLRKKYINQINEYNDR